MKRLTDEELAELEHVCKSWATRRAGDSFVYDADAVFGGLASLLVEIRERRATTEARAPRKHELNRLRLDLKIARNQSRSRAQRANVLEGVLELERKELQELRKFKAHADRIILCARELTSYEWECRLDDSEVSDCAKRDSDVLSRAVWHYDKYTAKGGAR